MSTHRSSIRSLFCCGKKRDPSESTSKPTNKEKGGGIKDETPLTQQPSAVCQDEAPLTQRPSAVCQDEAPLTQRPSAVCQDEAPLTQRPSAVCQDEAPLTQRPSAVCQDEAPLTQQPSAVCQGETPLTQRPSAFCLQRLLAQPLSPANLRNQIWCDVSLENKLPPSGFDTCSSRRFVCDCEHINIDARTCKSNYEENDEMSAKSQQHSIIKLQKLLGQPQIPINHVDQVWSDVFLGDKTAAENVELLRNLQITHVLNAAEDDEQNHVTAKTYSGTDIKYLGFKVIDDPSFDITPLLQPGALFIKQGVLFPGKVLVFCTRGVSRAAAFVLAYLMFYQNLQLEDAIQCIIKQRSIYPNGGFLRQLHDLDNKLFI